MKGSDGYTHLRQKKNIAVTAMMPDSLSPSTPQVQSL